MYQPREPARFPSGPQWGGSFTDPEGLGNLHQAASVEDTCFKALVKSFGKRDIRVCRVAPDYKLEAVAVITVLMHS